ncbi:MAG: glycosyltransferase family 4 protein [Geothermobacteraceae bacterium]
MVDHLLWIFPFELPYEFNRLASLRYIATHISSADAVVATSFETALPVRLYGKGRRFYFAQHFEPLFFAGLPDNNLAKLEAYMSYRLGLELIANSSWLKARIQKDIPEVPVELCLNAINHELFHGPLRSYVAGERSVKLISYGGRGVVWKGFAEMAEAVSLVRERLSDWKIEWQVYGSAALPPNNTVAPYTPLGFLQPEQLATAYRGADILLSASWYESFPLFPLEAMACGLPVVTSQLGTEDFAIHGVTAEVVEPQNVESIATGLMRLITDIPYRKKLAANGQEISRQFTWEKSVQMMQKILT